MRILTTYDKISRYQNEIKYICEELLESSAKDRSSANDPKNMRWEWNVVIGHECRYETNQYGMKIPVTEKKHLLISLVGRIKRANRSVPMIGIPKELANHGWVRPFVTEENLI